MSNGVNKWIGIGNLGAEPEMRFTANGKAVTQFRIACSFGDTTEWVSCVVWEKLAELCAEHLAKGSKVYVEGRLATRSWDDQNGRKHYKTEIVATQVLFLDGRAQLAAVLQGEGENDPEELPFE